MATSSIATRRRVPSSGTHAGVLVDEAIERHLRRAGRGARTEEIIELYGPPKSVVFVTAAPTAERRCVRVHRGHQRAAADRAVRTDFVANISHELKTPVGALAVLAETLADEDDPATHPADRRPDAGGGASRRPYDRRPDGAVADRARRRASRCVAASTSATSFAPPSSASPRSPRRREITIDWLDPDQSVTVTGDQRQLVSAVGNLVENAVKYSEIGGLVQIRSRVVGPWIEFMVIDQGAGIPSRDLDRIFERFYRVDKARGRDTGGTGLGLSIVRHVATNHGGDVQVSSRRRRGQHVRAAHPDHCRRRAPVRRGVHHEGRPHEGRQGSRMTRSTVLVVEDEASFVEALQIGLTREGFDVEVAMDGVEALEKFDARATRCRAARRDVAARSPGSTCAARSDCGARSRSSWSPPRAARSTPSSGSRSAPTTTSPSPTGFASSSPGCGP